MLAGETPVLVHNSTCLLGASGDITLYRQAHAGEKFSLDYLEIIGTSKGGRGGTGGWNWQRNKRFIDEALASGQPVRLVTDPGKPLYIGGNTFQRELKYLQGKGYGWRQVESGEFPSWEVYRVRP